MYFNFYVLTSVATIIAGGLIFSSLASRATGSVACQARGAI